MTRRPKTGEKMKMARASRALSSSTAAFDALAELALDLRWSWNHSADELWSQIDPELWALTHNPWVVLQTASRTRLAEIVSRPEFQERLAALRQKRRASFDATTWFERMYPSAALGRVGYFSMEFGLSEALPLYAGGLGNVAGDQLKAGSDLGVPVIGVGLLYQRGYFRQVITADDRQEALYPYNDPGQLPVSPVRDASGEWVRLALPMAGDRIWVRAWQVQVGRAMLYLLDTNDPANPPAMRAITGDLYGGGAEARLRQELVLGIGGWRLLRAMRIEPEVCHLNEGHAAFAVLERARSFMQDSGQSFEVALAVTRAGNLFTTHTAVPAGFDRFSPTLLTQYVRQYAEEELGIPFGEFLTLGRDHADDRGEPFNMAYLAIRGSGAANGVSRLHGEVSRRLFRGLFPRWPEVEVPIAHITNGVHVPTWDSAEADALWTRHCGSDRWRGEMENVERDFCSASDEELWSLRRAGRHALVEYSRARLAQQLRGTGARESRMSMVMECLDPDILTLGFARRFASYKRPNLLLHDPGRLLQLLMDAHRPVQLVLAGKAHPEDSAGQDAIREWLQLIRRPGVHRRVMFLPDYDLLLAERLVQGVDLWINTPRRPWEASGTSGMKVLVNGGLNLSELDGWWAEAFSPEVGWAIGDGREHNEDTAWDAAEADALYTLLEREIVPAFYDRDDRGIPAAWIGKMRQSMARLTPRFSANRAVREYTERYYVPAASAYRKRAAERGALGERIAAWRRELRARWPEVRFEAVRVETRDGQHEFAVQLNLGALDPDAIAVELFADAIGDANPVHQVMARVRTIDEGSGIHEYAAAAPADRSPGDYTPRVVPRHTDAAVPLEASEILWQR